MNRRDVVAGAGTVLVGSLAGCTANNGPEYTEEDKSDMLLSASDFEPDAEELNTSGTNFDSLFRAPNGATVGSNVYIEDSIEDAKDFFEQNRENFFSQSYDLAEEAFYYTGPNEVQTLFRDSNAVGVSTGGFVGEPNQTASIRYAEVMYEKWQEL